VLYKVPTPRGRSGYLEWQDVRTEAGAPYGEYPQRDGTEEGRILGEASGDDVVSD
jgi:hypothetical protein